MQGEGAICLKFQVCRGLLNSGTRSHNFYHQMRYDVRRQSHPILIISKSIPGVNRLTRVEQQRLWPFKQYIKFNIVKS